MKHFFSKATMLFLTGLLFYACSPKPYKTSNKLYKKQAKAFAKIISSEPRDSVVADSLKLPAFWAGTTNFGLRKPNIVIIHHTAQNSCEQTLQTFTLERTQVSAHYLICKDGTLHHMLNDYLRAWHAGAARWGNITDVNSSSIGIELDNNGRDTFTAAQLNTLQGLLSALKKNYNIPAANFIGHGDIAPGRKVDPNVNFPWKRFADNGYGLWYGDTTNVILPLNFDPINALRIIGYDVSDREGAIGAFRRHFLQSELVGNLEEEEKRVLYALMQNYF